MRLEKEMYARYKYHCKQKIGKIYSVNFSKDIFMTDNLVMLANEDVVKVSDILKASYSLIDLIEIGDYVNGKEVADIISDDEGNITDIVYTEETEMQSYSLLPIKNVVTKEQFDIEKYVVY